MRPHILWYFSTPGVFRICQFCGHWFALKLYAAQRDEKGQMVRIYRCKYCRRRIKQSGKHPAHGRTAARHEHVEDQRRDVAGACSVTEYAGHTVIARPLKLPQNSNYRFALFGNAALSNVDT
jgi:hypothetical protein